MKKKMGSCDRYVRWPSSLYCILAKAAASILR